MSIILNDILENGDFQKLRHRWEMPLIVISTLVTLIGVLVGIIIISTDYNTLQEIFGEDADSIIGYANTAALVLILPAWIFIYRFYMAAKAKSNAIRVGPNQIPELWEIYENLGKKLQMPRLPRLYVTNGNGVVNAYALSCNRRYKYIIMHAETVMAMKEHPEIVEFVLAHEMAHHKLSHVTLWRATIGIIPGLLFPLGRSTIRAQEYSADRVAKSVCNHDAKAMKLLAIGPWMHENVNDEAWLEQCETDRKELNVRIANILTDHAVMSKRYKALRDIDNEGYSAHGDMFL